jgi:hypothetical protein
MIAGARLTAGLAIVIVGALLGRRVAAGLVLVGIGAGLMLGTVLMGAADGDRSGAGERTCFPARSWAPAPDAQRPCWTIARLHEDGSGRLVIGSANGRTIARCSVPAFDSPHDRVRCSEPGS